MHRLTRLASIYLCRSQTATRRVRRDCITPSQHWIQRRPIGDATLRMRTLLRACPVPATAGTGSFVPLHLPAARTPPSRGPAPRPPWEIQVAPGRPRAHVPTGARSAPLEPESLRPGSAGQRANTKVGGGSRSWPLCPVPLKPPPCACPSLALLEMLLLSLPVGRLGPTGPPWRGPCRWPPRPWSPP